MARLERMLKDRQGHELLPVTSSGQVFRPGGHKSVEESLLELDKFAGGVT